MAETDNDLPDKGEGSGDYEVGYGKPPKKHRFQPGESGNPEGRRKGQTNLKTCLHAELETRVTVNRDGKRRTMTKGQLIAAQLVNSGVKGHLKSIEFLFRLLDLLNPSGEATEGGKMLTEEQRRMLMTYFPLPDTEQKKKGKQDGKEDGHADPQ
jgi:hypothetical protein